MNLSVLNIPRICQQIFLLLILFIVVVLNVEAAPRNKPSKHKKAPAATPCTCATKKEIVELQKKVEQLKQELGLTKSPTQ